VGFVFLITSPLVKEPLDAAVGWTEQRMHDNPVLGAVLFFLLSMLSATLNFTSSAILVPPANLAWGKTITFLLMWGGYVFGAVIAYGIGRLAHPLVVKLGYEKKLLEYKEFANTRMKFWVVVMICIAAQSELSGYLFGGLHYNFLKYMAAMTIVEALYAWLMVIAGQSLLNASPVAMLLAIAGFVTVALTAGYIVRKMKKKHTVAR
jgi:uncharacterized membrane protein YdjX (TVP38/TMEM64 family)